MKFLAFLLSLTLLFTISLSGQNTGLTVEEMMKMHNETEDDPYLPNAYHDQKTSPAYRYQARFKSTESSIFTIQVNVNSNGENIIGDAANEPSIAVNPMDNYYMAIGWRQFDNVESNFRQAGWAYSANGGNSWTFPGKIEAGLFRSDPVLDFDAWGNFYYNSLTNDPGYVCKVFFSYNGGANWDAGTDAGGGDKQWMVIDKNPEAGSGNIYSVWNSYFTSCPPGFFTRSTDANYSYEACTVVDGHPYWGTMAVGNSGELYIAGTRGAADSLIVVKSTNAKEAGQTVEWSPAVSVFMDGTLQGWNGVNPGGLLGQANVDVDPSEGPGGNTVYLLAPMFRSRKGDPCDIMFCKSSDGGATWGHPKRINDDSSTKNTQWFGTMSVAPNGRIDVIWLDTRDAPEDSDSSALYYSFSTDQGETWSINQKMSDLFDPHVGYPNQNKMGDYYDMVSDNQGAHLAWANTFNGEEDVYYSHIIPSISSGIEDYTYLTNIKLFPNPGKGIYYLSGAAPETRMEMFNMMGEKVYSATIIKPDTEIDISNQPDGFYFLKLVDPDGRTAVKKIIKEQ